MITPAFFLSTRGRMTRRELALGSFLPFFALMAASDAADSALVSVLAWAVVAWPVFVAHPWRRMHDMGRRGLWNLVFYAFYTLGFAFFLGEYVPAEGGWAALFDGAPATTADDQLTASGLGGLSTVLIFLPIQLVWLYAMPGQRAANAYGPPRSSTDES